MSKNNKSKVKKEVSVPTKTRRARHNVMLADDVFAVEWEKASSVDEFCEKTGYPRISAIARARYLRSKSVDIKRMPRGRKSNIDAGRINEAISRIRGGRS